MKFKAFGTGTKNALGQWVARCVIALVIVDVSMLLLGCPPNGLLTDIQDKVTNAKTTTYTVTYSGNGNTGGGVPVDGANYQQGQKVTVLGNTGGLTKTGYSFAGWNTKSDGSGTTYAQGQTFAMAGANVTLYAVWSPLYTVTYNANGASSGSVPVDPNKYLQGVPVTVLGNTGGLAKTGYTFVGWNTQSGGGGTAYIVGATFTMGSSNVMLYAQWTNNPTYTVTYNANGATSGNPPNDPNNYPNNAQVTVLGNIGSPPLAKTGYAFVGWTTQSGAGGTLYSAGSIFTITANVTLYAQWAATYQLTVQSGGCGSASASQLYYQQGGNPVTITATPISSSYQFVIWTVASGNTGNVTIASATSATTTLTLTAPATIQANFAYNPTTIYAATNSGIFISTNGGATWTNYTTSNSGLVSNNVKAIYYDSNSGQILAATYGGVSISTNGGSTWASYSTANSTGLGSNYINGIYYEYISSTIGNIFAATTGGLSYGGPTSWTNIVAGDYSSTFPSNDVLSAYAIFPFMWFAGTNKGLWVFSTMGGAQVAISGNIYGIAMGDVLYAATDSGVWRATNGWWSGDWVQCNSNLQSSTVNGVYYDTGTSTLFAATSNGLQSSTNLGASWGSVLLSGAINSVSYHGGVIYAATPSGLWASGNGGASWMAFPGIAGNIAVYGVSVH
jgi:uncharacterized repeat protein (TIGR02543 family)